MENNATIIEKSHKWAFYDESGGIINFRLIVLTIVLLLCDEKNDDDEEEEKGSINF